MFKDTTLFQPTTLALSVLILIQTANPATVLPAQLALQASTTILLQASANHALPQCTAVYYAQAQQHVSFVLLVIIYQR